MLRMQKTGRRRGVVLLLALGVLALLSVLAITFVRLAHLERSVSRNYVDRTRAVLAAESGVKYAMARLYSFTGSDDDYEDAKFIPADDGDPRLDRARKASFQMTNHAEPVSGIVSSSYVPDGDRYILRVEDESAKINLNDTDGYWNWDDDSEADPPDDPDRINAPRRLRSMVQILGERLFPDDPMLGTAISTALFDARSELPGNVFSGMEEVRSVLVPSLLNARQYSAFESRVTLWSWQDEQVLRPTHTLDISIPDGVPAVPGYAARDIYLYSDWQTRRFELEPRCPVNLNTASVEVLETLIAPLKGWYLREGPGFNHLDFERQFSLMNWAVYMPDGSLQVPFWSTSYYYDDETSAILSSETSMGPGATARKNWRFGEACQTPDLQAWLVDLDGDGLSQPFPRELAEAFFRRIHESHQPILTWSAFEQAVETWLEAIPDHDPFWDTFWSEWIPGPGGYTIDDFPCYEGIEFWGYPDCIFDGSMDRAYWARDCREIVMDLLTANFNPNSRLNDYNPDRSNCLRIDKAQLINYTTEFSFAATGVWTARSLGVVQTGTGGDDVAVEVESVLQTSLPFRVSTQDRFFKGFNGTEGSLGDYSAPGQRDNTPWNVTVMGYPEPCLADGGGLLYAGSRYDGALMLPTLQRAESAVDSATFVAHFHGKLEADLARVAPALAGDPDSAVEFRRQEQFVYSFDTTDSFPQWTPWNAPGARGLTQPDPDADRFLPGSLFPDGGLSDAGRGIAYQSANFGSDNGLKGALMFWLKPNFDTRCASRIRKLFSFHETVGGGRSQASSVVGANWYWPDIMSLLFIPHQQWWNSERAEYWDCFACVPFYVDYQWIPVNTLGFGYFLSEGNIYLEPNHGTATYTPTATFEHPNQHNPAHPVYAGGMPYAHPSYYFEPHQWTHIYLSWDMSVLGSGQHGTEGMTEMYVNGKSPAQWNPDQSRRWPESQAAQPEAYDLYSDDSGPPYAGFGGEADRPVWNLVADSTFDEIFGWDTRYDVPDECKAVYYDEGRYLNCIDRASEKFVYLAPQWDLFTEFHLDRREQISVASVAWTGYTPRYNARRDYFGNTSMDPDAASLENPDLTFPDVDGDGVPDPFSVDVGKVSPDGTVAWIADADGNLDSNYLTDLQSTLTRPEGSAVHLPGKQGFDLARDDRLTFRVFFHVNEDQILYESPVFDDITFVIRLNRPRILLWRMPISR